MRTEPAPSMHGTNYRPRERRMSTLSAALRKKYRSPRDALRALGLDESLLDVRRLALDGVDPEFQRAKELLAPQGGEYDRAAEDDREEESDSDTEEEINRRLEKIGSFLRKRGVSEDDIAEGRVLSKQYIRELMRREKSGGDERRDAFDDEPMPRNALARDRGKRRLAADKSFRKFFPQAARLFGSPLEAGFSGSAEEQARHRVTVDSADDGGGARDSFAQFFPGASRIGIA